MKYTVTVEGEVFKIELGREGQVWVNHRPYEVDLQGASGLGQYSLLVDHHSYDVHVERADNGTRQVTVGGRPYWAHLQRGHRIGRTAASEEAVCRGSPQAVVERSAAAEVRAPLPGLLVEMRVREGEHVEEQDVVAVLESMKMNLEIRAPRSGVICSPCGVAGRQVAQDEVLAIIGPNGSSYSSDSR